MAITDKVIELSPVNKKKNIVFYIIMGVLLATTVLFLVLYLVKPNVAPGAISGLRVTNNLFVDTDDSLVAVQGDTYTLCATVGYSGEADTYVEFVLPSDKLKEITGTDASRAGEAENNPIGDEITGDSVKRYCTFTPADGASGTTATVIVKTGLKVTGKKGQEEIIAEKQQQVNVKIVSKGTSELKMERVSHAVHGDAKISAGSAPNRYKIKVPYISDITKRSYYTVYLAHEPFTDKFGQKTVVSHVNNQDGFYSDSLELSVGGENPDAVSSKINNNAVTDTVTFTVDKKGKAEITVYANRHNSDPEVSAVLEIEAVDPSQMGYVTEYRLMSEDGKTELKNLEIYVGDKFDLHQNVRVEPQSLQNTNWDANGNLKITVKNAEGSAGAIVEDYTIDTNNHRALNALRPGKATVTLSDGNGLSNPLTFAVTVKYRPLSMGYYGSGSMFTELKDVYNGNEGVTAYKGAGGELTINYLFDVGTNLSANQPLPSEQVTADIRIDNPDSGIVFNGIKGNIISATAVYVGKSGVNVAMQSKILYTVSDTIGDDPVTLTLTTAIANTQGKTLKVVFHPKTQAKDIEFITAEEFETLKQQDRDALVRQYATFEAHGTSATLTLNMSDGATSFKVADLLKYNDGTGNKNPADGLALTECVYTDPSSVLTLDNASNKLLASLHPKKSAFYIEDRATFSFTLKGADNTEKTIELIVKVIDTPLGLQISEHRASFSYGFFGNGLNDKLPITIPTLTRNYASGLNRAETGQYSVAIYLNDPTKYLVGQTASDESNYDFYFTDTDYAALGGNYTADNMRVNSLFSVTGNRNIQAKTLYLRKDLFEYAMTGHLGDYNNKVTTVGITFYPEGKAYNDAFAQTFIVELVREIEKLEIDDGSLTGDSASGYRGTVAGGGRVTVNLKACIKTGASDFSAPFAYNDTSYGNLEQITVGKNDDVTQENGLTFKMPADEKDSTLTFRVKGTSVSVTYEVRNRSLEASSVTLYKDAACSQAFADGEIVYLTSAKNPSASEKNEVEVYYKVTYPSSGISNYITYGEVNYSLGALDTVKLLDPSDKSREKSFFRPSGNPSEVGTFEFIDSVIVQANGTNPDSVSFRVGASNGHSLSHTLDVHVYAPSSDILLDGSSSAANVSLKIDSADNAAPYKDLAFALAFDGENHYTSASGNVTREVSISAKSGAASDVDCVYDKAAQTVRVGAKGKKVSSAVFTLNVKEYADAAKTLLVFDDSIDITVGVDVEVYALDLLLDGNKDLAYEAVTDGGADKEELKLSVTFNNGAAGLDSPDGAQVTYVLLHNGKVVSDYANSPFKLEEKSDGWYLVYYNNVYSLVGSYSLRAQCGAVKSSNEISLSLRTTAVGLDFVDSSVRNIFDVSVPCDVSAKVTNLGDNNVVVGAAIDYKVVDSEGNDYGASGAPATVSADGRLTVTAASGEFKVVASHNGIEKSITVRVNNKVVSINVDIDGSSTVNGMTEVERIYYGAATETVDLTDKVTLVGAGGVAPYTDEWIIVPSSGSVFSVNGKVLTFGGVGGSQTFTVKAKSTPSAVGYDVERTVRVTVHVPRLTAQYTGSASNGVSVNLMDDMPQTSFALDVKSGIDGKYAVSGITLVGDDLGAGKAFSFDGSSLTLDISKIDTATDAGLKTYKFKVGALVDGKRVDAAAEAEISVTLTARRTFENNLFSVEDGNSHAVADGSMLTLGVGSYKVKAADGYTLVFAASGSALPVISSDGTLTYSTVGGITVRAVLNKYGKTFAAGQMSFGVKNDVASVDGSIKLVNGGNTENFVSPLKADYESDTDKKIIEYTADFSATGETFKQSDINLVLQGEGILTVLSGYPKFDADAGTYTVRYRVDKPGEIKIFASASVNGRFYTSEAVGAAFTMDGMPKGVTLVDTDGTLSYTFDKDADFKGRVTVRYEIVSGGDYIALVGNTYTHKVTDESGKAVIRVVLDVESGHYEGGRFTDEIEITHEGTLRSDIKANDVRTYLKGADGKTSVNLSDLYTITHPYEGEETVTVTVSMPTNGLVELVGNSADGYTVSVKDTKAGGKVTPEVTATFDGGKHGRYSKTCFVTIDVLPEASANSYYGVTAGGKLTLGITSPVGYDITAVYALTDGAAVASLDANVLSTTSGKGGEVTVKATPTLISGEYAGKALSDVTFKVYVRALEVKSSVSFEIADGSSDVLAIDLSSFDFVGAGGASAGNITGIEIIGGSEYIDVTDALAVSVRLGSNTALAQNAQDKTARVEITASDSFNRVYKGFADITVKPAVITVAAASVYVNDVVQNAADGNISLTDKDRVRVSVDLTADGYVFVGDAEAILSGGSANAVREDTENGIRISVEFAPEVGSRTLKLLFRPYNAYELCVYELGLEINAVPDVSMSFGTDNASVIAAVDSAVGASYNEYTFVTGGTGIEKIVFEGLTGAELVSDAAAASGNTLIVNGTQTSVTVKVYALSAGKKSFTAKATVNGAAQSYEITCARVSFEAVDVPALTLEARGGGVSVTPETSADNHFDESAEVIVSAACGSFAFDTFTADGAASAPVFTVKADGNSSRTVNISATVHKKTLNASITLYFDKKPAITEFKYVGGVPSLKISNLSEGDYTVTYSVKYGAKYGAVDSVSGAFTAAPQREDGIVVIEAAITVTKPSCPFVDVIKAETEITVTKAAAPEFTAVASGNTVTCGADFDLTVTVLTGNATVTKEGGVLTVTYTADGDVLLRIDAVYNKAGSPYNGDKFTEVVKVDGFRVSAAESGKIVLDLPAHITNFRAEANDAKIELQYDADTHTFTYSTLSAADIMLTRITLKSDSDGEIIATFDFTGITVPAHKCEHECPTCGNCTDADCMGEACTDKCEGHTGPEPAAHACESVCADCGKCTNEVCTETACTDKCDCESVAP